MSFREVRVFEVREALRLWLRGEGIRAMERMAQLDRKTVRRYVNAAVELGLARADGEGQLTDECQVDFGRLGLVFDSATGRRRVCHALVFTACVSRHCFVWLSFTQTTGAMIAGFEAAWSFFGGVFRTVIPDNLKAVVEVADSPEPRFNQAFVEYAQARGFAIDPARVRTPTDKPRVERNVAFVQSSLFAGEEFVDLADAQRR